MAGSADGSLRASPGRSPAGSGFLADVDVSPPPAGERYRVFCNHLQNMIDYLGSPERAVRRMRKNLVWYTRGLSGAGRLRRRLGELESAEQMRQAFAHLLRMQRDGEA